jgi:serine/threonine-protein kinase
MSKEKEAGSPEYFTALFYSGTGQKEEALVWLEKAYDSHDTELTWLKVDPMFKSLHGDPRYEDLLKRVGFPK